MITILTRKHSKIYKISKEIFELKEEIKQADKIAAERWRKDGLEYYFWLNHVLQLNEDMEKLIAELRNL